MSTIQAPARVRSCDASELVFVHQAFKRIYSLAPGAVLGTDPSDSQRVAVVAKTLRAVNSQLHHHHTTEDNLIWDTLDERKPACALHVGLMRAQHASVAELLEEAPALLKAWRTDPNADTAETLAEVFTRISTLLDVHLRDEETKIIPVIEEVMSTKEWNHVQNAAKVPSDVTGAVLFLGLIMEVMPPHERAEFESTLPTPLMWVWQLFGRKHYDRLMAAMQPSA